jgi:hypothetical protein
MRQICLTVFICEYLLLLVPKGVAQETQGVDDHLPIIFPELHTDRELPNSFGEKYRKAAEDRRQTLEVFRDSLELTRSVIESKRMDNTMSTAEYKTAFHKYTQNMDLYKQELVGYNYSIIRYKTNGKPEPAFVGGAETIDNIPKFPWPPPHASATEVLPGRFLTKAIGTTLLKEVASKLENAFDTAGYTDRTYYSVPGGFALVSRLEQFNEDGTCIKGAARWSYDIPPPTIFSLTGFIKALFTAHKGHFRIIVFIVTSHIITESDSTLTEEEAEQWLRRGALTLPNFIGDLVFTDRSTCSALIYEFEQTVAHHDATFKDPSGMTGLNHLQKTNIWTSFGRNP